MSILSVTAEQLNDDAVQYFEEEGKLNYIFPSQPIYRWLWHHSTALVLYGLDFEALKRSWKEDPYHISYGQALSDEEKQFIENCKFNHRTYLMMPQYVVPVIIHGKVGVKPTVAMEMKKRVRLPDTFDIQNVKSNEWPEWIIDQCGRFNPELSNFKIYLKNCEWPLNTMPDNVAVEDVAIQFYPIKDALKTKKIEIMV